MHLPAMETDCTNLCRIFRDSQVKHDQGISETGFWVGLPRCQAFPTRCLACLANGPIPLAKHRFCDLASSAENSFVFSYRLNCKCIMLPFDMLLTCWSNKLALVPARYPNCGHTILLVDNSHALRQTAYATRTKHPLKLNSTEKSKVAAHFQL